MVRGGIVLNEKVSLKGIKFDRAKVNVIEKLPIPTSMKELSFLGHATFIGDLLKLFQNF